MIFSNLQYDIWEDVNSNKTVFAFKGTNEKLDWLTNLIIFLVAIQYKSAKKHVIEYIDNNPSREVVLTGYSLGGGVSLSVSLWFGLDMVVFNTPPRVFDGFGDNNINAHLVAIFQENDILDRIRKSYPKFRNLVNHSDEEKNIQIIRTVFKYLNG